MSRKSYPSDVNDDEWTVVAPYLILMPDDLPPCPAFYQWLQRWIAAGCSEVRALRRFNCMTRAWAS